MFQDIPGHGVTGILFRITDIGPPNTFMNGCQIGNTSSLKMGANNFGHSPNNGKLVEQFEKDGMRCRGYGNLSQGPKGGMMFHGSQIFPEVKRVKVHKLYPPNRKALYLFEGKLQKGACCYHVKLGHLLIKITQQSNGFGLFLNLIEEQQGFEQVL